MLPMRPITPAHASIASLSIVLPDDAWPTITIFRRSPAEGVAITQICSYSKHAFNSPRAQAENLRLPARALWSDITPIAHRDWIHWIILRQAARDACAPEQKCLLDARCRKATRLLLRPIRVLRQKLERSQSGSLGQCQSLTLLAQTARRT